MNDRIASLDTPASGARRAVARLVTVLIAAVLVLAGAPAPASGVTGPAHLQRLAQKQTQLLLAHYTVGQVTSPASCRDGQPPSGTHGVFLLPTLSFSAGEATLNCRLDTDTVLLDLGGGVVSEDNRADSTWTMADGSILTFQRSNLERICDDLLRYLPAPAPATLDGKALARGTQLATRPVDARVGPGSGQFWDDSVALGHPGVLAASYCGWKTKLQLRPGRHTIVVDLSDIAGAKTVLTYVIVVKHPSGHSH